jgi:hypothetical protein
MKRSRELIEVEATINEWPEAEVHPFRVAIQTLRRLVEVDRGALKRALEEDDEPDLILAKLLALTEKHIARVSTSDASDAFTCLKLLEATTDDPAYQRAFVPIIPSLLLAVPLCMTDEPLAGQCLVAILRVLINLYLLLPSAFPDHVWCVSCLAMLTQPSTPSSEPTRTMVHAVTWQAMEAWPVWPALWNRRGVRRPPLLANRSGTCSPSV